MFDQKSSLIIPDEPGMWVPGMIIPQPDHVISLVPEIWAETLAKMIVSELAAPGPIPYFPGAAQPPSGRMVMGNVPVSQTPSRGSRSAFGLILVMDVVPEYVARTFQLVGRDSGMGYNSDLYSVFMEGESLDTSLRMWLIVYTNHEYHAKRASELDRQLRDLIVDGVVVSLPVVG